MQSMKDNLEILKECYGIEPDYSNLPSFSQILGPAFYNGLKPEPEPAPILGPGYSPCLPKPVILGPGYSPSLDSKKTLSKKSCDLIKTTLSHTR